ncbi:hypothetical protein EVAR_40761_1 [Eumeta japonica]|uniref:Uncharacterized protein n=1 Tax=Eumeta variegata TaxID=151549 RepID=A0A4C1X7M8_EUMVA|nr:hypothetical protein EVAR_40761_1 [Eumeta japonica]
MPSETPQHQPRRAFRAKMRVHDYLFDPASRGSPVLYKHYRVLPRPLVLLEGDRRAGNKVAVTRGWCNGRDEYGRCMHPAFIVSDARDYARSAFRAAMQSAQVERGGAEGRVGERNTCALHHSQAIQSGRVSCIVLYVIHGGKGDNVSHIRFDVFGVENAPERALRVEGLMPLALGCCHNLNINIGNDTDTDVDTDGIILVYYPNCRLPDHVDRSYEGYARHAAMEAPVSASLIRGKHLIKYSAVLVFFRVVP